MLGVKFESVDGAFSHHTFEDWNLKWYDIQLGFPEVKTHYIDVPGANGVIDLTQALTGDVKYKNRSLSLSFDYIGDFYKWQTIVSKIANLLHGQQVKIILDIDKSHYYLGRISINTSKSNVAQGDIVLSGSVDPYKYELTSSVQEWLWDSFNFETDVIREYQDLQVAGALKLNVVGSRMPHIPTFICNGPLTVEFKGMTYDLPAGVSKVLDIVIREGDNELLFRGNGSVSVDYRGGSL